MAYPPPQQPPTISKWYSKGNHSWLLLSSYRADVSRSAPQTDDLSVLSAEHDQSNKTKDRSGHLGRLFGLLACRVLIGILRFIIFNPRFAGVGSAVVWSRLWWTSYGTSNTGVRSVDAWLAFTPGVVDLWTVIWIWSTRQITRLKNL